MKMYYASMAGYPRIEEREAIRKTSSSVFFLARDGKSTIRESITTSWYAWRDTHQDAKQFVIDIAYQKLDEAEKNLNHATLMLGKASQL